MSRRSRRRQFSPAPVSLPHLVTQGVTPVSPSPLAYWLHWATIGLFQVLVLTVPFFFTWTNEELFEFNKMMLTYGLTLLIAATWIGRMVVEQRLIFKRTKLDILLAIFVGSQLLSTLFSIHPPTSLFGYYTRFHGGLLSTLTYVTLFYAFVSNIKRHQLPAFLLTLFLAGLGVSLYAIPEHFGTSPSCALISGEWNVSCWVQDVQSRVFGTFGQPNWLAAYAITLIPLGLSLTVNPGVSDLSRWVRRGLYAVSSASLLLTLWYTKSRSGLLGFEASMALYLLGFAWIKKQSSTHYRSLFSLGFYLLGGLYFLATVGVLVVGIYALAQGHALSAIPELILKRQLTAPAPATPSSPNVGVNRLDVGGTDSGEIRKIVWQGAIDVWKRYPILGSGVETFAYSYYQDRPMAHNLVSEWDFLYNKAHNELLNYLATTGIVGLGAYLSLYAAFLIAGGWTVWKTETDEFRSLIALGTTTGLVALFISNFFGFSTVMVSILLFLYPAINVVFDEQPEVKKKLSFPKWVGLGVLSIVTLYGLISLVTFWRADKMYALGKQLDHAGYSLESVSYLTDAILAAPNEALYYDELSHVYAKLALALVQEGQATQAGQVAQAAILNSDQALSLNPRHLNFYKTRARVFITLGQLNPEFLKEAKKTLERAIELSPTEAKLYYNLGAVQISLGDVDQGIATLEKSVVMKPNYEAARYALGQQYETTNRRDKALEQYRYIIDNINPNNEVIKEAIKTLTTDPKDL